MNCFRSREYSTALLIIFKLAPNISAANRTRPTPIVFLIASFPPGIISKSTPSQTTSTTGRVESIVGISLIVTPGFSVSIRIRLSSKTVIIILGFNSPSRPKIAVPETFESSNFNPALLLFPIASVSDTHAVISPDAINGSHFSDKKFPFSYINAVGAITEFPIQGVGTA